MSKKPRPSSSLPGQGSKNRAVPRHENAGYAVGYGRPPSTYKYKPGQSGYPRGRPKGTKNEKTILRELLHRKIAMREGGRIRYVPILQAILLRIAEDALKGNTKSAAFLLNRYGALISGEPQHADTGDDDAKILEAFAQRILTERTKAGKP